MAKQSPLHELISARVGGGKHGDMRAESVVQFFEKLMDVGYDALIRRRKADSSPEDRKSIPGIRKKPRT